MPRTTIALTLVPAPLALALLFGATGSAVAAEPPAGQRCPAGAYVIGFDGDANIICSGVCGNGIVDPGESCDDGNAADGDGCSARCLTDSAAGSGAAAAAAVVAAPAAASSLSDRAEPPAAAVSSEAGQPAAVAAPVTPVVEDVEPSSLVYGTRELSITVMGEGFNAKSVVRFQGAQYPATVNPTGTELQVTLPTRGLLIGRYPITVSNGPGLEHTLKKAIAVY
jgi:cysteine-rich repeat protein